MLALFIQNDGSGNELIGNYKYKVMVNEEVIAEGVVLGHTRQWGWKALVYHLLCKEK
ncbi:MAG: hypothetical protein ACXABD_18695 [Candidatus Thorarchaeota archaeon]|jgi:hypothetical protein